MSVWVRLALVPRMLTRSFSEKPPSPPAPELMLTPGMRCTASATFLSGSLPMSSAVITSTTESALRFWFSDCSRDARMPVTVTVSSVVAGRGSACWAWAGSTALSRAAAAAAIGVRLTIMRGPRSLSRIERAAAADRHSKMYPRA